MKDTEIIQSILNGDKELYSNLVRSHMNHVIGICRGLLTDPTLAEDAAQEIFIKVFQTLHKFRGDSQFSTWLYRVATNHCLDVRRKLKRRKTQSLEDLPSQGDNLAGFIDPARMEKVLEMKDFSDRILNDLSDDDRTALILREGEGLSYEEIAAFMRVSLDAVKSRLKRARDKVEKKVRHLLASENV